MPYKLSKLKAKLNELGIFDVTLLPMTNSDYTNEFPLTATQWVKGTEVEHRIHALTLAEGLGVLIRRAEGTRAALEANQPVSFTVPDIAVCNMVGHINKGNVEYVDDVIDI